MRPRAARALAPAGRTAGGTAGVTSATPLLEVAGLSGGYRSGSTAIDDLSFAVEPGQKIAVLGPNGGGKTTLFRALLGELPERRGEIRASGELAYVPQTERSRLDYPVSALDVALMGTYSGLSWYRRVGSAERESAAGALARVGLAAQAATAFGSLSGGQRQRVLIARALAQRADILLLDEPLSGVDRPSAARVMTILDELRDEGRALLVATHDIQQAREFDAVLCLNREQVAFGAPRDALSPTVLERTYGGELIVLDDERRAVIVQHHAH
ncbi:MAG: ATP-binding cassette domain-containing protein [Solirubrobacterales bacterium]|nr:ATP-binding cassette domain-containing protein [Solirubrobacterales bacterium]